MASAVSSGDLALKIISKKMAMHFRNELATGKHKGSGRELTQDDVKHRRAALASRQSTVQARYRNHDTELFAKVDASLKAQADRVIDSTTAHTTAEAERSNAHTTTEADRVVAALKEDKGPAWREDMTGPEQKVYYQNRRAADLNKMRDLGLVSKPAQPTEKPQGA